MGWRRERRSYPLTAPPLNATEPFKRVIGDALRSRTDARQATEVAIAVELLNRMLELGRPESVRIA